MAALTAFSLIKAESKIFSLINKGRVENFFSHYKEGLEPSAIYRVLYTESTRYLPSN